MKIINSYVLGSDSNFFKGLRHDSKSQRAIRLIYVMSSQKGRDNTLLVNALFQFSHPQERGSPITAEAKTS